MSEVKVKKIVYVDGVFDLFHIGHVRLLKRAKEYGDYLIVGVISDNDSESYKRTPYINEQDRAEVIASCRYVDKVIPNSPLYVTKEFIIKHMIDIVIHGNDSKQSDFFKIPIKMGIMKYISYTNEISTTNLIKKIKNNNGGVHDI